MMDISEREFQLKRAEEELHLLLRLSMAISEAQDFQSALKIAISSMCEATGWSLGEVWLPGAEGKALEFNFAWHCNEKGSDKFVEDSKGFQFLPGIGLPGRVWLSKKPEWIRDVSISSTLFLRYKAAIDAGLKAGLGVPIVAGDQVLAVLLFYMSEAREEDPRLVDLVTAVSAQLGNVLQRKRSEDERLEMQKRYEGLLLHSQKMEAIGQLAGGVAHDFNNAFTAIIGFGNLLLMKMEGNPVLRIYVEQILAASEKAAKTVQDLLTFSRTEKTSPCPTDLNELVKNIASMLSRLIGPGFEFKTFLQEKGLIVKVDHTQMEQVLMNLATNARDAMPDGGTITIRTEAIELNEEFTAAYGYGAPGMFAMLSFEDTGAGIDDETKKRVFEPFFTTKQVGKGTGLGLAMVYGILKHHSGFITVDSHPKEGTTFKLYLPLINRGGY